MERETTHTLGVAMSELNEEALSRRDEGYVALVGDSVFDNKAYVPKGHDVQNAMYRRRRLSGRRVAYLAAVDGAKMRDVPAQLAQDEVMQARGIYISVGGNDLIGHLGERDSFGIDSLYQLRESFREEYRANVIDLLVDRRSGKHIYNDVTLCTIYNPSMNDTLSQQAAEVAVSLVNDVIISEAGRADLQVLELRNVMTMPEHFTMEIEPSMHGSDAIAHAIGVHIKHDHDWRTFWPRLEFGKGLLHSSRTCSMCLVGGHK